MGHAAAALLAAALLTVAVPRPAAALPGAANISDWTAGRATFYGQGDGFSIHEGSCEFGQVDPHAGTGWDIAALSVRRGAGGSAVGARSAGQGGAPSAAAGGVARGDAGRSRCFPLAGRGCCAPALG
jgi:hypothetical protein